MRSLISRPGFKHPGFKRLGLTLLALCLPAANAGAENLTLTELEPGLYQHQSFQTVKGFGRVSANGLLLVEGKNAFLIDTPWGNEDTEQLLAWLKARDLTLEGSLSTHWHEDRAGGLAALNAAGVATFASAHTNRLLAENGKVQASHSLDAGPQLLFHGRVEAFFPGAGHSLDNLVAWLPGQKTLFGGCLVRSLETQSMGNTADGDVPAWPVSIEAVLSRYPEAARVVPGHGDNGDIALLRHTLALSRAAAAKPQ
ncbi:subclass B1 metallo-beta-lactamase [Shewanella cyperi]|uniref:beta-lactamase n=1 Tax=Shewanella cyperi TaxID=2814292 RepID=A0A975ALF9_9GAMM|nr:subclass B1 metallo-beta-lactamase [Shewanella cyperi]QSX31170.1 subclass B1 metallo-beta-lactamase [Shewanella cyperi]